MVLRHQTNYRMDSVKPIDCLNPLHVYRGILNKIEKRTKNK